MRKLLKVPFLAIPILFIVVRASNVIRLGELNPYESPSKYVAHNAPKSPFNIDKVHDSQRPSLNRRRYSLGDDPIRLTRRERDMQRINNPVVINYSVKPEQMLSLMHHD